MSALLTPSEALQRSFELPTPQEPASDREPQTAERRYGVRLAEYGLLLPQAALAEIAETLPDCRLPNTPAWFAGVMNQRGNIVPVFDLAALLETQSRTSRARARVLIVGTRDEAVGLQLRELPQTVYISTGESLSYNPVTNPLLDRYVRTTYNCSETLWLEWDMDGFFAAVGESLGACDQST